MGGSPKATGQLKHARSGKGRKSRTHLEIPSTVGSVRLADPSTVQGVVYLDRDEVLVTAEGWIVKEVHENRSSVAHMHDNGLQTSLTVS